MFDWPELGVIAVVALIFIGPKDMPVALKTVTGMIKKARRMASEFQGHVDDMVRDADLNEVRDQISSLRGYNVGRALEKLVDDDGSLRRTFTDDPFSSAATSVGTTPAAALVDGEVALAERPAVGTEVPPLEPRPEPEVAGAMAWPDTPAFIPPGVAPPAKAEAVAPEPPAFIPPEFARAARPSA